MIFEELTPFETPYLLRIAITGGIGCGKSYICHQLTERGFPIFNCDEVAKHIIRTDPTVRQQLIQIIGSNLYDNQNNLVKSVLAQWLCRGKEYAKKVDLIVHPHVAAVFRQKSLKLNQQAATFELPLIKENHLPRIVSINDLVHLPYKQTLFMECALLFESNFNLLVNKSVLVHVSRKTQLQRLMQRDKINAQKAEKWINLQLSEKKKIKRSDYILPNDN